jgi:hypothetical protein
VLDELIAYLKTAAGDRLIRVEGHADNMEIGPSLKSLYQTNWDLSKARAGGVLRYLIEKGGIDSAKLSSVGYGDTKPMASNVSEVGRQKNRRVDIVLYSPESAGEQSEPAAKPIETGDNGYSLSRLSSAESGAPTSAADTMIPVAPTGSSKVEPSSVPADTTPAKIPASVSTLSRCSPFSCAATMPHDFDAGSPSTHRTRDPIRRCHCPTASGRPVHLHRAIVPPTHAAHWTSGARALRTVDPPRSCDRPLPCASSGS